MSGRTLLGQRLIKHQDTSEIQMDVILSEHCGTLSFDG